jgi:hypothetical protein
VQKGEVLNTNCEVLNGNGEVFINNGEENTSKVN